jgi:hypothetical protein
MGNCDIYLLIFVWTHTDIGLLVTVHQWNWGSRSKC